MGVFHVNPEILEKVERRIVTILEEIHASALLLIDRSGLVLAWAGDPPLHPNQMGAVAAGICAAMRTLLKTSGTEAFTVSVNNSGSNLQFQHVEEGLFLCAFTPIAAMKGWYVQGWKVLRWTRGIPSLPRTRTRHK